MEQKTVVLLAPSVDQIELWTNLIPKKWASLVPVSREQHDQFHETYIKEQIYEKFRDHALALCAREWKDQLTRQEIAEHTAKYNIHHKLPLFFGGTNDFDNLILIYRPIHTLIHTKLDNLYSHSLRLQNAYKKSKVPEEKKIIIAHVNSIPGLYAKAEDNTLKIYGKIHRPKGASLIPYKLATLAAA